MSRIPDQEPTTSLPVSVKHYSKRELLKLSAGVGIAVALNTVAAPLENFSTTRTDSTSEPFSRIHDRLTALFSRNHIAEAAEPNPDITDNYEVINYALKGSRLVSIVKLDGSSEQRLVIADIDFIRRKALGIDMGPLPLIALSVDVNGDNLVVGGRQLKDPTKGALCYSQHGGNVSQMLSFNAPEEQIEQGPVQRVNIPYGYFNERNTVFFVQSEGYSPNPYDPVNIPQIAKVLDLNTGIINTLTGPVAKSAETSILPIDPTTYKSAGITIEGSDDQAGYTIYTKDIRDNTVTAQVNTEGTNGGTNLSRRIVQYYRESDRKRITLTINPETNGLGQNSDFHHLLATLNYNIEDRLVYQIQSNIHDPAFSEMYPSGIAAATEAKYLYIAAIQMISDPVTHNPGSRTSIIRIDPLHYEDFTKQEVIGNTKNGLPMGDWKSDNGTARALEVVKDGEGGDILLPIYNKGIWLQEENGTFVKILIEKKPKSKYRTNLPWSTNFLNKVAGGW